MKAGHKRRVFGLAIAVAAFLVLPLLLIGYYEEVHKLAAKLALQLLEKNDRSKLYTEVYAQANKEKIIAGSWMEDFGAVDGNERSFRHYYDPQTGQGCAFQPYFYVWTTLDGASVTYAGLRYPGALDWARDGAGTKDVRNWKGAIEAYDYTEASRAEAYFRVGHVVHLIADMAEPDHATNTIHAASGFYYPKDLNKILAHVQAAAEKVPGFKDMKERLEAFMAVNAAYGEQRVGFEELIEKNPGGLLPKPLNVKVNKFPSLDLYFNTMGRLSQDAIRGQYPLPIGVRFTPETTESEQATLDGLMANYSFFPAIEFKDPPESERYFSLARKLLESAIRLDWGLLEFFHDLVNPPPYVRSVMVSQYSRPRYFARWKDIEEEVSGTHPNENKEAAKKLAKAEFRHKYLYKKTIRRELPPDQIIDQELTPGVEAEVRVDFGPDPKDFSVPPEQMQRVAVLIEGELVSGRLVENGRAWVGRFTPSLEEGEKEKALQIEIDGWDAHNHCFIPGRLAFPRRETLESETGYRLDCEPDFPAKTSSEPPYHVRNYEPGVDRNHKVKVRAEVEPEEEVKTESSPYLYFKVAGDVVKMVNRDTAWSFNLTVNTPANILPALLEKEEWIIYPKGQLYSTYRRAVRENNRVNSYFVSNITSLARPPENRMEKGGEAAYELDLFEVDAQGRFKMGGTQKAGNLVSHWIWVTGRVDPFIYRLRLKGKGLDGKIYQADFVFDSKDWVPAGKDSSGNTIYRKR